MDCSIGIFFIFLLFSKFLDSVHKRGGFLKYSYINTVDRYKDS
jgi:hypothetical protein